MSASAERAMRLVAWLVVAFVGAIIATQALGADPGRAVAVAQTLTPHLTLMLVGVAGLARWRRWWAVGAVSSLAGLGGVVLATPIVFPPGQPAPQADAEPVEVAAVNLLYENDRSDDVGDVLLELDADVIVFTEYTAEHQAELLDHPLADRLPHRAERDGLLAGGTAIWSRYPVEPLETPPMTNYDVDVVVDGPAGPFRVWAVHPPTPFHPGWVRDLHHIADRSRTITEPLVVAGDFNASYWHPAFRDLLRAGLNDAHLADGRGWSASWPTDRWFPAFVRIDHALTNDGLVSVDVDDFTVPGSDHRGLVVTVLPAAGDG